MPHALLLSPDDQAVSAITGVLEELSVTCERPLDGPSAAKKLNSESFDLVLVDCENLPAAKLIFDVCRRPNAGVNPVPIAIVDGRAGLPTAFRLGAELILTKPVAKDQARTTIRTAVNRIKKDEPVRAPHLFEESPAETVSLAPPEVCAHAAAAAAAPSVVKPVEVTPPAVAKVEPVVDAAAPAIAKMQPSADEMASPRVQSKSLPIIARDLTPPQSFAPLPKPGPPAPAPAPKPSEDPVLADLESDLPTPVVASRREPEPKKGHASLWLLLFLMLAGGFYAAWMYQPGFREIVQPWVERAIGALHVPGQSQNSAPPPRTVAPSPAAPRVQAGSTKPAADASSPTAIPGTASGSDDSSTNSAAANSAMPASKTAAPAESVTASSESGDTAVAPPASTSKSTKQAESTKNVVAAVPSDTELPGEKSAVILSSQGAEKRLLHHVSPVYPAATRRERIEGTVVLKAVVSEGGRVEGVRLVEGNPTLAAAAISAVKQWRYRPYLRSGKAMPFQTIVLVEFQRN